MDTPNIEEEAQQMVEILLHYQVELALTTGGLCLFAPYYPDAFLRTFTLSIAIQSKQSNIGICKYINKGSDAATFSIQNKHDEVQNPAKGETTYIPRIPLVPTDLPFAFKRLQFPVNLCFAITINKSQGQTFNFTGVDLREEVFSNGQLYVALSRIGTRQNQVILTANNDNKTRNMVFAEVFNN